jgi:hypothetical protein
MFGRGRKAKAKPKVPEIVEVQVKTDLINEPDVHKIDLAIEIMYTNDDMYVKAEDLLVVVKCINNNGGSITDLLKLLE